jgi:hypothetical protein
MRAFETVARRSRVTPLLAAACVSGVLACSDRESGSPAAEVRDSAGVHVVESVRPAWPEGGGWRVVVEPSVRIGLSDGDAAYQFDRIRGVMLLDEGGFVVLDGGTRQFRRYDAEGRHVWSVGGPGRGPAQFEAPLLVGRAGDGAFLLWDRSLSRMTVVAADGDSVRTDPPTSAVNDEVPIVHDVFDDGAWLATYPHVIMPPAQGTLLADTIRLWRVDPASLERRMLVELPGPVWIFTGRDLLPVPFTANPLRAIAGTNLVATSGAVPAVRVLGEDGTAQAHYILPLEPAPVTPSDVRAVVDWQVGRRAYGASARVWDEWLERMPVPDRAPAYDRLMLDGGGAIWLRRFVMDPADTAPPRWDVLGTDGAWLGTLTTPPGLEVFSIAGDLLAGVTHDSLDVEHVAVHRIAKVEDRP